MLGVAAYAAQFASGHLFLPWYLPASGIAAAVMLAIAFWRQRSAWRAIGLTAVVLVAAAECLLLFATRLPPYTGPVAIGKPFPAFLTTRADGMAFTDRDLPGSHTTVLTFFRGRW